MELVVHDDIPSIQRNVISIVYHAIITLCGHEWKGRDFWNCCCGCYQETTTNYTSTNTGTSSLDKEEKEEDIVADDDILIVQQWRQELYQMVENTITFRMSNCYDTTGNNCFYQLERTKLYDIEIRTAMAYFQRYRDKESTSLLLLKIVSDMGVTRIIHSAYQLAYEFLLPMIEYQLQQKSISNHVRVAKSSSFICCISHILMKQIHIQQQKERNDIKLDGTIPKKISSLVLHWESCPYCPLWCHGGKKGLWWHLQQQHAMLHHTATEIATIQRSRNMTAMIVYSNNGNHHNPRYRINTTGSSCTIRKNDTIDQSTAITVIPNTSTTSTGTSNPQIEQQSYIDTAVSTICTSTPEPKIYSDPWECIQTGGTLSQFIECLDQQPSSFDCCHARDKYGAVLLHWAAGNGNTCIVKYLVELKHCPINIKQIGKRSYTGRTPLHWAARNGHYYTVLYILQYASKMIIPPQQGSERVLLETKPYKNLLLLYECMEAKTEDGTTPFCWASWQGHLNIMQLFYQYGCQVNTMNKYGCNAVLWAAQHQPPNGEGDVDDHHHDDSAMVVNVLQWLIDVGCHYLVVNHSGHGVLHKGAQRGSRDTCTWYLNQLTTMIEQQQKQHHDTLSSDFVISILNVFGPNNDDCTPSDLAGMENYIELALYLSEQEQQFVQLLMNKSQSPSKALPKWLSPLPKGIVNRFDTHQHSVWEPGAGVFRMRSVLVLYDVK